LAFFLVGCGKKDASSAAGPGSTTASSSATADKAAGAPTAASGRQIEITGNDTMKFSITEIRAKPGESLSVTLSNIGSMPKFSMGHNWVLLKPSANIETFVGDAAQAATTDYIPQNLKSDVLAHTKLLGPKEKDTVTFQAPKQPGRYPFICSFPGHYQVGMKGDLIVE
jgi:azurin